MRQSTKVVLSDIHIGTGHVKGRPNFFDDFRDDDRLAHLLTRVGEQYADTELELILNGDIFDLLKVPVNGLFPEAITEGIATLKLELCLRGHPMVVEALRNFLRRERRTITVIPGNHDMEFVFPEVDAAFTRALTGHATDERVRFVVDRDHYRLPGGVEVHHGQQFEAMQSFDFKRLILERGLPEPILNLPWGSLFVLQVLNKLKEERPFLDKVKPFWPVLVGGLVLDTRFTLRALANSTYYFLRARVSRPWRSRRPFTKLGAFLKNELRFFEKHEDTAQRRFKNDPSLRALVMGHTHTEMVRTYDRGERIYVNTGTWVPMVNLSLEKLGEKTHRHYAVIRYDGQGEPNVSLVRWYGRQQVAEELAL